MVSRPSALDEGRGPHIPPRTALAPSSNLTTTLPVVVVVGRLPFSSPSSPSNSSKRTRLHKNGTSARLSGFGGAAGGLGGGGGGSQWWRLRSPGSRWSCRVLAIVPSSASPALAVVPRLPALLARFHRSTLTRSPSLGRPSPSTSSTLRSSTSASRTSSSGLYRAPTRSSWCVSALLSCSLQLNASWVGRSCA